MKGYKAFDRDLKCRGFQYEIGKTYKIEGKPIVCRRGFHFCRSIAGVYAFYDASDNTRICEVEAIGEIDTNDHIKFCTNKIKIVKEITDSYLKKANTGAGNYGYCNSGNRNSGDWNSGDCNSGYGNSGNFNSGKYNSGNRNSGNFNSGDCNSGYGNSGKYNSGNRNSGDWNFSSCNSGCFCTEDSNIKMFDENSNWTYNDWLLSDAYAILSRCPHTEPIIVWINESDMNEEEKKNNPSYLITGGYLKVTKENVNRQRWWNNLSKEDKNVVMSLPNFDADKFYICTGIKVMDEDDSKNK